MQRPTCKRQRRSANVGLISTSATAAASKIVSVCTASPAGHDKVLDFQRNADEAEHLPDRRGPHRAAHSAEIAAHVSLLR
jgi:hypothetical protein